MAASLGRTLVLAGLAIAAIGVVLLVSQRFPGLRLGRLPGDVAIERPGFRFYFPLGTSILLSVVVSLLFWMFGRR